MKFKYGLLINLRRLNPLDPKVPLFWMVLPSSPQPFPQVERNFPLLFFFFKYVAQDVRKTVQKRQDLMLPDFFFRR